MRVTNQLITQAFLVPEISVKLLTYDRLRWYRSSTGRTGYFEAATAELPTQAAIETRNAGWALADKTLRLRINGTQELEFLITGPEPVKMDQLAAQINGATAFIEAEGSERTLKLTTALAGSAASIEVLASEGAVLLGFFAGECATGLGVDNALLPGVSEYRFSDHQSSPTTWYTVEYRNSLSGLISVRSAAFLSRGNESVPMSQLIGCFVRLCDLAGRPLGGRHIVIHNVNMPNRAAGDGKSWGVFRQYEELVTDPNGYAEAYLIRGSIIDFTITGTGFTRRVTVPPLGTIVDLLDPLLDPRDEFGIQKNDFDFAIRTTL